MHKGQDQVNIVEVYLAETAVVKEIQSLMKHNVVYCVISSHIAGLSSPV